MKFERTGRLLAMSSMTAMSFMSVQAQAQSAPAQAGQTQGAPTTAQADATGTPGIDPATSNPQVVGEDGDIVVTGFRQSLQNAQTIKRNATEIVDSIVAEDIGKLPDNNLSEALQRVPGVQITRNHGEGSGIAIRGLTQVKTLINGREAFSDNNRDLSLENIPPRCSRASTSTRTPRRPWSRAVSAASST